MLWIRVPESRRISIAMRAVEEHRAFPDITSHYPAPSRNHLYANPRKAGVSQMFHAGAACSRRILGLGPRFGRHHAIHGQSISHTSDYAAAQRGGQRPGNETMLPFPLHRIAPVCPRSHADADVPCQREEISWLSRTFYSGSSCWALASVFLPSWLSSCHGAPIRSQHSRPL